MVRQEDPDVRIQPHGRGSAVLKSHAALRPAVPYHYPKPRPGVKRATTWYLLACLARAREAAAAQVLASRPGPRIARADSTRNARRQQASSFTASHAQQPPEQGGSATGGANASKIAMPTVSEQTWQAVQASELPRPGGPPQALPYPGPTPAAGAVGRTSGAAVGQAGGGRKSVPLGLSKRYKHKISAQHLPEEWAEVYGKLPGSSEPGQQQQQQQYAQVYAAAASGAPFAGQPAQQPQMYGAYNGAYSHQQLQEPYHQQHAQGYPHQALFQQQQSTFTGVGMPPPHAPQLQQRQGMEQHYQQQLQPLGQAATNNTQGPAASMLVELPRSPGMGDMWEEI